MVFQNVSPLFAVYVMLLMFQLTTAATNVGIVRKGHTFGAINFDRISGYALVNATYLTIENLKLISCISECKKNKACYSLNFRKVNGGTLCELNELDRYAAESETAFQKQPDSEHYEIKSPCKNMVCHMGGRCHVNHQDGTHQCRCPLQYAGEHCERLNPYSDKFREMVGIVNGELFNVEGSYNHEMAKKVCAAFGAVLADTQDIGRAASEANIGFCVTGWTKEGSLGYPEYEGNCHSGSTDTGYYSIDCCPDKVNTSSSAWCLKKNIDFCKPGWYASKSYCYLLRDDDSVTWAEAKEKCNAKEATLARITTTLGDFQALINRACSDCLPMHVGAQKVGDVWNWISEYTYRDIDSNLWSGNEPQGDGTCAEWSKELGGMKTIPCDARRGYVCRKHMP